MKKMLPIVVGFSAGIFIFNDINAAISFAIFSLLIFVIFFESNDHFVFREWALLLYCLNYLVAPAISYKLDNQDINYSMKILPNYYFELAIPAFILFAFGMYIIPTRIFRISYDKVKDGAIVNEQFLLKVTIVGIFSRLIIGYLPGEFGFVIYLFSLIRFVSAFALYSINKKYWYWSIIVLVIESYTALISGMYHDAVMWIIFFGLYFVYATKPNHFIKMISASSLIIIVLFVQAFKSIYRSEVWYGSKSADLSTALSLGSENANSEFILGESNLLSTLNRGNQAWIFASTVDNMDRKKNFQGMTNVNKYLEAALLPRFLAPNKLSSGNKEIFNEFSGHLINEGTSMGLGIFADGYIAYGAWGVYSFGFILGLIFALTFKLVERWTKVSPFYVLLLLPLLNYAVRPDCELQTTINHLVKGMLLYGGLVFLTKNRFTLENIENKRKLIHLNLASKSL